MLGWYEEDEFQELPYTESLLHNEPISHCEAVLLGGTADLDCRIDITAAHRIAPEDFDIMDFGKLSKGQRDPEKLFINIVVRGELAVSVRRICHELGCSQREFIEQAMQSAVKEYDAWKARKAQ